MEKSCDPSGNEIFEKGTEITSSDFSGAAWLKLLVPHDSILNCSIGNVTFAPGSRNNWHKHPGGQILLITGGQGYYQEEGKPVQVVHEGEVVMIYPDVKHWHGAGPDGWFTHIAVITNVLKGATEWLEPVNDEEYYNSANEVKQESR